jgi:hypothetical protein
MDIIIVSFTDCNSSRLISGNVIHENRYRDFGTPLISSPTALKNTLDFFAWVHSLRLPGN